MIISYLRGMKPEEVAPVTKLVILLGSGFCERVMSSMVALSSVSHRWDIKVEVLRKSSLEFNCAE